MKNKKTFSRVDNVAEWRLCTGCGACVPMCPNRAITLTNVNDDGLRPVIHTEKCQKCGTCVAVCPGIEVSHRPFSTKTISELRRAWGPILEIWEGYATDHVLRYNGSSGGLATALALFCLEMHGASGVLQIGTKPEAPLENVAVFSKSRDDLLACTGSRYSPAAPCEKLDSILNAAHPGVFVGKPCDIVALRKAEVVKPELKNKIMLAISIFCAGTPAADGTNRILSTLGIKPEDAKEIRYRGCGWPGVTSVKINGDMCPARQLSYEESWGSILSNYTQFRCRICPDSTGELADISCGDPWYREISQNDPGWSLVLVRSERGREILKQAMESNYVSLERVAPYTLPRSQKAILIRRCHLWGRLTMMKMMRVPIPHYVGFYLLKNWLRLSIRDKIASLIGTLKRIVKRGWNRPVKLVIKRDELKQTNCNTGKELLK